MVESVSYVLLRDVSSINPKKAIEIVRPSTFEKFEKFDV